MRSFLTGGLTPEELSRCRAAGATMREADAFELARGGDV